MYHLVMSTKKGSYGVVIEHLQAALTLRNMSPADLARESGVSKATLSLILNNKRHKTSAANVVQMARALNVSMDYLMGLSEVPEPTSLMLGDLLNELTTVARGLPTRKQRDLLMIARAYADASREKAADLKQLQEELMDLVREYEGVVEHGHWIDILRHLRAITGDASANEGDEMAQGQGDF